MAQQFRPSHIASPPWLVWRAKLYWLPKNKEAIAGLGGASYRSLALAVTACLILIWFVQVRR